MKKYLLLIAFIIVCFNAFPDKASAVWYSSSWLYRKAITVDNTKVSTTDHTNFPILVDLTDAGLQANAQADGDDILFTSSDGTTKLDHEIELYTTATGRLTAWVEIPTLLDASDTVIYMYYGNSGATNQQNVTGTWNSAYLGVWHMKDGTTLSLEDSTASNYDIASASSYSATAGKIDGGALQGGTSYMNIGTNDPLDGLTAFTFDAYVYNQNGGNAKALMSDWTTRQLLWRNEATNQLRLLVEWTDATSDTSGYSPSGYAANVWTKVAATYDGTTLRTYSNGVAGVTVAISGKTVKTDAGSNTLNFGGGPTGSEDYWVGRLDEYRIANTARSAGWIATEYNNQSATSTFYTIGSQESDTPAAGADGYYLWFD